MKKLQVQVVAAIVVIVFAAGILLNGGKVHIQWLKFYSVAVFGALLILGIWDRLLWRLGWIQRINAVPSADSESNRPPIPIESGHPFRRFSATPEGTGNGADVM